MSGSESSSRQRVSLTVLVALLLVGVALYVLFMDQRDAARVRPVDDDSGVSVVSEHAPALQGAALPVAPDPIRPAATAGSSGRWISGTVMDVRTQEPIPGAFLYAANQRRKASVLRSDTFCRSGDDGTFMLRLRPEEQRETLTLVGFANGFLSHEQVVKLDPGGKAEGVAVVLRVGAHVEGEVVDELGRPVPGVRVSAAEEPNRVAWPQTEVAVLEGKLGSGGWATTDQQGRFVIHGLHPDREYELRAGKEYWYQGPKPPPLVDPATAGIVSLQMRPIVRLRVRAVDSVTRKPLSMVGMGGAYFGGVLSGHYSPLRDARVLGVEGVADARLGGDGVLTAEYLRDLTRQGDHRGPPELHFTFRSPGYTPKPVRIPLEFGRAHDLEVELDRRADGFREARFSAASPTGIPYEGLLHVRVRSLDLGEPWSPEVLLRFSNGVAGRLVKVPLGEIAVGAGGGGPSGRWLRAAAGPRTFKTSVTRGEKPVELRITVAANPVVLEVVTEDGALVSGYDLSVGYGANLQEVYGWSVPWAEQLIRVTDDSGRSLPVVWVPKGEYWIDVNVPKVGRGRVQVPASGDGERLNVRVTLDPAEARDPRGEARRGAALRERLGKGR